MDVHRLSRAEARRIAVSAQLLDRPRPTDLLEVVRQLTLLQIDPTAAIAPSADLVAWSRLGASYEPSQLRRALEEDRTLVEFDAMIRPMSDIGLLLAGAKDRPSHDGPREWLRRNDRFRRDILQRLRDSGPLPSRDIPDTSAVPWASTGWTNARNVTRMLEFMVVRGEVAIAGRRAAQRLWDLPERVYPADMTTFALDDARRLRNERRVRALGIARPRRPALPTEPADVADAGEPAVVEGVPGAWRVDPEALGRPFAGRTALLSPFDRLVHDRARAVDLFEFDYLLEMYKPKSSRRWGYFALPVLYLDRLVGKLDATADRRRQALVVHAIHEDVPFTRTMSEAVRREIHDLAKWLGLAVEGPGIARSGRTSTRR